VTPPFRFSAASGGEATLREWQEAAREVEALGYAALFVTDHIHQPLSPLPAVAAAAAVTTELRVGTYVLGQDLHHPVVLAKELASLDVLTDGRLEVGFGAGWLHADYTRTGIPYRDGPERAARFEEAFSVVKGALTTPDFSFAGKFFTFGEAGCVPPSVQRPHPPLLVGAARRRLLSFAAREADAVSFCLRSTKEGGMDEEDASPDSLDEKVGWVREAAGARAAELPLDHLLFECFVTPNPAPILEAFAAGMGMSPDRVRDVTCMLIGTTDEVVETLLERRERWGISEVRVPLLAARSFAPVVERLAGDSSTRLHRR
jgi:probable F420-dependent oxidoreductase